MTTTPFNGNIRTGTAFGFSTLAFVLVMLYIFVKEETRIRYPYPVAFSTPTIGVWLPPEQAKQLAAEAEIVLFTPLALGFLSALLAAWLLADPDRPVGSGLLARICNIELAIALILILAEATF